MTFLYYKHLLKNLGIGSGGRSGGGTSKSFAPFPVSDPPSELFIPIAPAAPMVGTPSIKLVPLAKPSRVITVL